MKQAIFYTLTVIVLLSFMASMISCTDATRASLASYGNEHRVTMFNGGVKVREWTSTGKVTSIDNSDGWQFKDKATKKLVRVGGDVIIEVLGK